MAAIFLRPGHADPAAFADPLGKAGNVAVAAVRTVRIEGAACDLFGEKGADFLAQLFALFGQADGIETEGCGHFKSRKDRSLSLAATEASSLSHGERVGVRGYGLSLGCNPSPGSHLSMRSDLSHWE